MFDQRNDAGRPRDSQNRSDDAAWELAAGERGRDGIAPGRETHADQTEDAWCSATLVSAMS